MIARIVHAHKKESKQIVASLCSKESKSNSQIDHKNRYESKITIKKEEDLTKNEWSKDVIVSTLAREAKYNSHNNYENKFESNAPTKKEENVTLMEKKNQAKHEYIQTIKY